MNALDRKDEDMLSPGKWTKLAKIVLSELSQSQTDKHALSIICDS